MKGFKGGERGWGLVSLTSCQTHMNKTTCHAQGRLAAFPLPRTPWGRREGGMDGWMILIRQPSEEEEEEGEPLASSIHPSIHESQHLVCCT